MTFVHRFLSDDCGFVVSSELVMIATIVVIGLIAGLTSVRDQVIMELGDVSIAVTRTTQSYSFSGVTSHAGSTAGTVFRDRRDFCDTGIDNSNNLIPNVIIGTPASPEN